ncbi:MAG TPA: hypothetical protein VG452_06640 [Egibacteraceae bacterium]|nr:hypothetical protein [Egibacteraceae bacterium]
MDEQSPSRRPTGPLDASDPRFGVGDGAPAPGRLRTLVPSQGPGPSPLDPRVRALRVALPALFAAGLLTVAAVFYVALDPGSGSQAVGPAAAVRAAVAPRPHRVCYRGSQPCAWLTVVDGELLALNTSGPLREEFGRLGVAWCPSSGYFGSNTSGSRFDQAGRVVRGPAPRGLDRFALRTTPDGGLVINFFRLTTGLQAEQTDQVRPPAGPDCPTIPFDRDADLRLAGR